MRDAATKIRGSARRKEGLKEAKARESGYHAVDASGFAVVVVVGGDDVGNRLSRVSEAEDDAEAYC